MFSAMYPVFYETVRQARSVYTERMKFHCRAIARAVTREVKQAKNPVGKFRACKRVSRAIREVNHAYKRKCNW